MTAPQRAEETQRLRAMRESLAKVRRILTPHRA
jgi:hypothetical protein